MRLRITFPLFPSPTAPHGPRRQSRTVSPQRPSRFPAAQRAAALTLGSANACLRRSLVAWFLCSLHISALTAERGFLTRSSSSGLITLLGHLTQSPGSEILSFVHCFPSHLLIVPISRVQAPLEAEGGVCVCVCFHKNPWYLIRIC